MPRDRWICRPLRQSRSLSTPRLDSQLNRMVGQVGLASPDDIVLQSPMHLGSSVAVTVRLSGGADAIAAFIEKGGGIAANVGVDYVEAYVPVTILVEAIVPPQPTVASQGAAAPSPNIA